MFVEDGSFIEQHQDTKTLTPISTKLDKFNLYNCNVKIEHRVPAAVLTWWLVFQLQMFQ